jgi:hypothetical protein
MAKSESVSIKSRKLTKSDDAQINFGESRISKEHWDKCAKKCKGEKSMISKLGISDERTKIKEK